MNLETSQLLGNDGKGLCAHKLRLCYDPSLCNIILYYVIFVQMAFHTLFLLCYRLGLGSESARFARALTFLAPAECFYGYCTLSVTTIQIQHEIRVGRSPDRPEAK